MFIMPTWTGLMVKNVSNEIKIANNPAYYNFRIINYTTFYSQQICRVPFALVYN